jgi:hypothetical protein
MVYGLRRFTVYDLRITTTTADHDTRRVTTAIDVGDHEWLIMLAI